MTQLLKCQSCGYDIDTMLSDKPIIIYHKHCWEQWLAQTISAARGEQWYNLKDSEDKE